MENTFLRSEINRGCPFVAQPGAEDPAGLLECLSVGSEHVLGLFSSAMAGQKEGEFNGMVARVTKAVTSLASLTQSADKEFVKEVADRVGHVLSTICEHVSKEQGENVTVATSLLDLGDHLADLHGAAVHRYSDGLLG